MAGLTIETCVTAVVQSTPFPGRYKAGSAASTKLQSLGVTDSVQQGHFLDNLKKNIKPFAIDTSLVTSTPDTTVQIAASSVLNNAVAQ